MGYNTPILILNDVADLLKSDPYAGRKLYDAILESARGAPIDVSMNDGHCFSSPATVLPSKHADSTRLIVVGQNSIRELAELWYVGSSDEALLKALADKLGYRVAKKPKHRARQ